MLVLPSLLLLAALLPPASGGSIYAICVVLESGFTMLQPTTSSVDAVTSDSQLRGFDVDMRVLALHGLNYTVRVLPSYGEVQVRTRSGECDVGWAQFFQLARRSSCEPDAETCRSLADLNLASAAGGTPAEWTP